MHTHSAIVYGIFFRGNLIDSNKIFLQRKRIVRTILGINPLCSCKPHFKIMGIVTMPSQYILPLMEFLVNNLAYFSLNSEIHNKLTKNRKSLHILPVNMSLYQKGVQYMTTKFCNSLLNWIADLVQNKKKFIGKLKSVFM